MRIVPRSFAAAGSLRKHTVSSPSAIGVSIADLLSYAFLIDSLTVVAVGRVIMVFETAN